MLPSTQSVSEAHRVKVKDGNGDKMDVKPPEIRSNDKAVRGGGDLKVTAAKAREAHNKATSDGREFNAG